jgi:transcription elongation factor GreA
MSSTKVYVTKEGLERVQQEHTKLREFKKQKTMGEMPSILHSEDANPEYLAFQEDMSLLDARLAEYENIINNAELIVLPGRDKRDMVCLGAVVSIDINGVVDEFMIVGTMEADPLQKRVSNESPIGKALLGARIGDTVSLYTPVVKQTCKILNIEYRDA